MLSSNNHSETSPLLCCLLFVLFPSGRQSLCGTTMSPGYGRLPPNTTKEDLDFAHTATHCNTLQHFPTLRWGFYVVCSRQTFLQLMAPVCTEFWSIADECTLWLKLRCTGFPLAAVQRTVFYRAGAKFSEVEFIVIIIWHRVGWGETIRSAPIREDPLPTSTLQHNLVHCWSTTQDGYKALALCRFAP